DFVRPIGSLVGRPPKPGCDSGVRHPGEQRGWDFPLGLRNLGRDPG
ncbi:unnamed protein product, partial [Allacma fusca]